MKRNKKTQVMAHEDLAPLTEHILAKMGKEGLAIRKRLKHFYREKALFNQMDIDPQLEGSVCEVASS